jgi:hypothetical protein
VPGAERDSAPLAAQAQLDTNPDSCVGECLSGYIPDVSVHCRKDSTTGEAEQHFPPALVLACCHRRRRCFTSRGDAAMLPAAEDAAATPQQRRSDAEVRGRQSRSLLGTEALRVEESRDEKRSLVTRGMKSPGVCSNAAATPQCRQPRSCPSGCSAAAACSSCPSSAVAVVAVVSPLLPPQSL